MKETTKQIRTKQFNSTIKSLFIKKPANTTYYQHALDIFLCPLTKTKHKLIVLEALKKYHDIPNVHIKLGLLIKTYVSYYNSNFTTLDLKNYLQFYIDNILID